MTERVLDKEKMEDKIGAVQMKEERERSEDTAFKKESFKVNVMFLLQFVLLRSATCD